MSCTPHTGGLLARYPSTRIGGDFDAICVQNILVKAWAQPTRKEMQTAITSFNRAWLDKNNAKKHWADTAKTFNHFLEQVDAAVS